MNEAVRFIRYIIPGLVSLMTLGVMFLITDCTKVFDILRDNENMSGIGSGMAVLLVSSALGYLCATLYFMLFKCCDWLMQNHKPLFEGRYARFRAVNAAGDPLTVTSRRMAWLLVCQYVYSRMETSDGKDLKGIDNMGSRFTHHIHSQGAAAIGIFVAGAVWLLCMLSCDGWDFSKMSCYKWLGITLLWLILQFVFWFTRCQTIAKHDLIINSFLSQTIAKHDLIINSFLMGQNRLADHPEDLYYIE